MSFSPSLLPYTGTAKIFSLIDIKRATENFDDSRILGEGGFGLVYSGTLDDGRKVAVKVLKRDDHQGSREFLAEVEMLSRLHHRNLVKLLGICTEDQTRCLIYELVPNGSVESHLHGTYLTNFVDNSSVWFSGMISNEMTLHLNAVNDDYHCSLHSVILWRTKDGNGNSKGITIRFQSSLL